MIWSRLSPSSTFWRITTRIWPASSEGESATVEPLQTGHCSCLAIERACSSTVSASAAETLNAGDDSARTNTSRPRSNRRRTFESLSGAAHGQPTSGGRHGHQARARVRPDRDQGTAEGDDPAQPEPDHQRVDEGDEAGAAIGVPAGQHDVEILKRRRADGYAGARLALEVAIEA